MIGQAEDRLKDVACDRKIVTYVFDQWAEKRGLNCVRNIRNAVRSTGISGNQWLTTQFPHMPCSGTAAKYPVLRTRGIATEVIY